MIIKQDLNLLFRTYYKQEKQIFKYDGTFATILDDKSGQLMEITEPHIIKCETLKYYETEPIVFKMVPCPDIMNPYEDRINYNDLFIIKDVSYNQNAEPRLGFWKPDYNVVDKVAMIERLTNNFNKYKQEHQKEYGKNSYVGGKNLIEQHNDSASRYIKYKYSILDNIDIGTFSPKKQYIYPKSLICTYIGVHQHHAYLAELLYELNKLNFEYYDMNRIKGLRVPYTMHFLDKTGMFILSFFTTATPKKYYLKSLWRELFMMGIKQTHPKYFNNTKEEVYISENVNPYITKTFAKLDPNGRWDEQILYSEQIRTIMKDKYNKII